MSKRDFAGILAIITGSVICLVASVSVETHIDPPPQTMAAVLKSLDHIPFLSFVSLVLISATGCFMRLAWLSWQSNSRSELRAANYVFIASSMGVCSTFCSNAMIKMLASSVTSPSWDSDCNSFKTSGPWILFAIFILTYNNHLKSWCYG